MQAKTSRKLIFTDISCAGPIAKRCILSHKRDSMAVADPEGRRAAEEEQAADVFRDFLAA